MQKVCKEEGDMRVSFMHPKGPGRSENSFFWPTREDRCYIPETEILCKISAPIPSSKSARKYILSDLDSQFIADENKLRELNEVYRVSHNYCPIALITILAK